MHVGKPNARPDPWRKVDRIGLVTSASAEMAHPRPMQLVLQYRKNEIISRLNNILLCVAAIFFISTQELSAATVGRVVNDPIFGLWFDSKNVRFDDFPARKALASCRENLREAHALNDKFHLFAQVKQKEYSIYLLASRGANAVFVVRSNGCAVDIPSIEFVRKQRPPEYPQMRFILTQDDSRAIFRDALARYSKAFGGKAAFYRWLDERTSAQLSGCRSLHPDLCPPTYKMFPQDLQQILNEYRNNK